MDKSRERCVSFAQETRLFSVSTDVIRSLGRGGKMGKGILVYKTLE